MCVLQASGSEAVSLIDAATRRIWQPKARKPHPQLPNPTFRRFPTHLAAQSAINRVLSCQIRQGARAAQAVSVIWDSRPRSAMAFSRISTLRILPVTVIGYSLTKLM